MASAACPGLRTERKFLPRKDLRQRGYEGAGASRNITGSGQIPTSWTRQAGLFARVAGWSSRGICGGRRVFNANFAGE